MSEVASYLVDVLSPAMEAGAARVECPVSFHARRIPDQPAIREDERIWTYSGLDRAIRRVQLPGTERVVLQTGNEVETLIMLIAALRAGRGAVLIDPRLPKEAAERVALEGGPSLADRRQTLQADRRPDLRPAEKSTHPGDPDTNLSKAYWYPSKNATFMRTSGSTGVPRIVSHTAQVHLASARSASMALELGQDDIWLWSLPVWHVGGLAIPLRMWCVGGSLAHPRKGRSLWAESRHFGATRVSMVATQLEDWIVETGTDIAPSVKDIIVGGGPVPEDLIRRAVALGLPIRTTYGSTETASMVTLSSRRSPADTSPHAGIPLPGARLETGSDGRIRVGTAAAPATLLDTRDIGFIDTMGRLTVQGRLDDVFISGGENIDPAEIERALLALEAVRSARVVPAPDRRFGHRPAAFVRMESGVPDEEEIRAALRCALPGYMIPVIVTEFPKLPEGQLKWPRKDLVEMAVRTLDTRREG